MLCGRTQSASVWYGPFSSRPFGMTSRILHVPIRRAHRLPAPLPLLRRHVLCMRGPPPEMPKQIFELARAVAVKLIHDGLAFFGASGQRSREKRVDVLDVEMDTDGRSAQRFRPLTAVLQEFARQHDH